MLNFLHSRRPRGLGKMIAADEMACFAYCPEQWRLQYGQGLASANRSKMAAGTRHHERKAVVERVAGVLISLGQMVFAAAALILFLLWMGWR